MWKTFCFKGAGWCNALASEGENGERIGKKFWMTCGFTSLIMVRTEVCEDEANGGG